MANTTETILQSEPEWQVLPFESRLGNAVAVISPSSYRIEIVGVSNVVRLLTKIAYEHRVDLPDGARIYIPHDGDSDIYLTDTDPWINPGWSNGDIIGKVGGLARALGHYLMMQSWAKKEL